MTGPMASTDDVLNTLRAALAPHGVFLRGITVFATGEAAPALRNGQPAKSVVLLGNIGGSLWPAFERWRTAEDQGADNPLDRWSQAVIEPMAQMFDATAYFPSDPPYQPFQQWAMRAEGLRASPLGILIHPDYGLWHGYRGALGFDRILPAAPLPENSHPCDRCIGKPCISACPADAISAWDFRVTACRSHLATRQGQSGCMSAGCVSRNACPIGAEYRYPPEQLRFHMAALDV